MNYKIVVGIDSNYGIGISSGLAWNIKQDMQYFKKITSTTVDPNKRNAVIMGRTTWESIPKKFRPLPNRLNVVLSKNLNFVIPNNTDTLLFDNLETALIETNKLNDIETVFIMGGGQIYNEAIINYPEFCQGIYLTKIDKNYDCSVNIPNIGSMCQQMYIESDSGWLEDSIGDNIVRYKFLYYLPSINNL